MSQQHIRVLPAKISLGASFFFFLCAFCFLNPIPFFVCVCVIVLEAGGRYNLEEARHGLFFFSKKDDCLNRFSAEGVENMRTVRPFLSLFLPFLSLSFICPYLKIEWTLLKMEALSTATVNECFALAHTNFVCK